MIIGAKTMKLLRCACGNSWPVQRRLTGKALCPKCAQKAAVRGMETPEKSVKTDG